MAGIFRPPDSDLAEPAVPQQMTERGPRATLVPGCGHAPASNTGQHFALV